MNQATSFIKSSLVYFLGNILVKLTSFIMLPIYTKYISPDKFGTYDLSIAYLTFFTSILFLDIWSGIMRFMFDYKEDGQEYKAIYNGMVIFGLSTILYILGILTVGNYFEVEYMFLIFLYGLLMNIQNVFAYVVRAKGESLLFALSGLVGTLVIVVVNTVMLVGLQWDYSCLYISYCVGMIIQIIILNSKAKIIKKNWYSYLDIVVIKDMIKYSIPLAINSAAYWFLTSYNKVVISQKLTTIENGLYAVAGKFSVAINLITSCFTLAWQEVAFKKGENKHNQAEFYSNACNLYLKFLGMGTVVIIPLIFIVFPYMINQSYINALDIIPIYILGTVASSFSLFLNSIFGAIKKTNIIFITTVVGSVVNVVFINLLIDQWGLISASISLFLGYLISNIIRLIILKKKINICIDLKFLGLFVILFLGTLLIYTTGNSLYNMIWIVLMITISLIIFREYISLIAKIIKQKLGVK
ncbi:lipopolysaccharide biosynthesis protein [Clostridium sp.]|uniref:lipopolysaccharide biosynthesis protein n=1 Tax=Clostridium sp. TaxID=1506 RepID=UPI0029026A70|nr:oligosaccharide flippase family protein [Clostridium sp.]MBS7130555.1 oligosaccharide flippase family protein [Clostridium sp.]MDU2284603.1 oligosaccharide flippase family protein [Clostridium sp.]